VFGSPPCAKAQRWRSVSGATVHTRRIFFPDLNTLARPLPWPDTRHISTRRGALTFYNRSEEKKGTARQVAAPACISFISCMILLIAGFFMLNFAVEGLPPLPRGLHSFTFQLNLSRA